MEMLRLTCAEFMALPEYSASVPTGVSEGKRWRRHHRYTLDKGKTVHVALYVGEYFEVETEGEGFDQKVSYSTRWFGVVFRVPAGSEPIDSTKILEEAPCS